MLDAVGSVLYFFFMLAGLVLMVAVVQYLVFYIWQALVNIRDEWQYQINEENKHDEFNGEIDQED